MIERASVPLWGDPKGWELVSELVRRLHNGGYGMNASDILDSVAGLGAERMCRMLLDQGMALSVRKLPGHKKFDVFP